MKIILCLGSPEHELYQRVAALGWLRSPSLESPQSVPVERTVWCVVRTKLSIFMSYQHWEWGCGNLVLYWDLGYPHQGVRTATHRVLIV